MKGCRQVVCKCDTTADERLECGEFWHAGPGSRNQPPVDLAALNTGDLIGAIQ